MADKTKFTERLPEKFENIKNKLYKKTGPKWKTFAAIGIIAIIILVLAFSSCGKKKGKEELNTATAAMGFVTQVIEGEGTIEVDRYDATSLVKGEIIACYIEEGDYVEKDQVLYEIDSGDMENSITRAKNSLETAQDNYNIVLEDVEELNVKSPIGGVIQKMYVNEGQQVNPGTVIADVVDSSLLKLQISFLKWDAENLYPGLSADVMVSATGEKLTGTVTKVSTGAIVSQQGVAVSYVEIEVKNPGALMPGDVATATVNGYACAGSGTFSYNASETVTAKQSGKIRNINLNTADIVYKGSVICSIENDSLKNNLKSAKMQVENAQLSLDDLNDTLENYKIKSSISGKVIQKNSKVGDKIDTTNAQTVMAIVSDPLELSFEMMVDELDIAKIKEGQEVMVTAKALEKQVFKGYVDNVSEVGAVQNGVTTYPVKIIVEAREDSGLMPGMNVDAVITIDFRENVLTIPNSAIMRGNVVYVKEGSPSLNNKTNNDKAEDNTNGEKLPEKHSQGSEIGEEAMKRMQENAPHGFVAVTVEVGLSDDSKVEIISGLLEGDIVVVQEEQSSFGGLFGMFGGMPGGGGMPAGNVR